MGERVVTGVIDIERIGADAKGAAEERNTALVRKIFTGFAASDFSHLYANMVDPSAVTVVGMDFKRLGKWLSEGDFVPKLFDRGMRFEILSSATGPDVVFVQWHDRADASTGKAYENDGLSVFKFNDQGKIVSYYEYFDPEKFYEVL
jgi:ketosteroid isomerase-like protein